MNVQFARLFGTFLLASNIPVAAIQRHGFPTLPLGLQVYPPLVFPLGIILRENTADLRIPRKHLRISERPKTNEATTEIFVHVDSV